MAIVWCCRLSEVKDVVRELFRLVGADSELLRGGMIGGPKLRPLDSVRPAAKASESDKVRFLWRGTSMDPGLLLDVGARRLDRLEPALDGFWLVEAEDFKDDRR